MLSATASAQSLSGLRIGESISSTPRLGAPPDETNQAGPFVMKKWTLGNGNQLSITAVAQTGRIVYMESDWGKRQAGSPSDFPGLAFGSTTLRDIRKHFGNNGFAFRAHVGFPTSDGTALFNCYQLTASASTVVAFVTIISGQQGEEVLANKLVGEDAAKLDALILADMPYLETIWGKEKIFDGSYRPIGWK